MNDDHRQQQRFQINTNTGVSIGIIIICLAGFGAMVKGMSDSSKEATAMKTELSQQATATKNDLSNKIDKLETRILNLESAKNTWTSTDMFKWAVHLQQANPQIKVPEPEVSTK
jgi:hypothetical protein